MRMRFKPYARPELLACDFHVHEPLTHAGHWHELFFFTLRYFRGQIDFLGMRRVLFVRKHIEKSI